MSTTETARKLMVQERKQTEHIEDNMLERSAEAVAESQNADTNDKARELLAQERQQQAHLQDNMLERATEEIS